jgi:hypothetical protein
MNLRQASLPRSCQPSFSGCDKQGNPAMGDARPIVGLCAFRRFQVQSWV